MNLIRILVILAIAVALADPALAQRKLKPGEFGTITYKCLDSRGKVYYSDKLSPECDHVEEMNRQGRVVGDTTFCCLAAARAVFCECRFGRRLEA